jgi:hypothetical protein
MNDTPGAIVQLLARGPQEEMYLDGSNFSLFQQVHRRSSNFAIEHRPTPLPKEFTFGNTCRLEIPHHCDMVGDMYIEIHLPQIFGAHEKDVWKPYLPYILFRRIKLWMDEVLVVDQERVWSFIHDTLFLKSGHMEGYHKMIGFDQNLSLTQSHTLLIPIHTPWSTKRFLPMITLFNTKVFMDIELEQFEKCIDLYPHKIPNARYISGGQLMSTDGILIQQPSSTTILENIRQPTDISSNLIMQCVYIETPERHTFVGKTIGYQVEHILDTETIFTRTNQDVKIDLRDITEPCKALYWVVYPYGDQTFTFIEHPFTQATISIGSQILLRQSPREFSIPHIRSDTNTISILPLNTLFPTDQFIEGSIDFGKIAQPSSLVLTVNKDALISGTEYMLKVFTITKRLLFFRNGRATI